MKGTNLYLPLYDDPGMFLFQNLTIYFGSFSSTAVLIKYIFDLLVQILHNIYI